MNPRNSIRWAVEKGTNGVLAFEIRTGEVPLGADGLTAAPIGTGCATSGGQQPEGDAGGDRAFFYHSNEGKEIVGIVEIVRTFYPDPADPGGKFGMVDVAPVMPVKTPVTLTEMKGTPDLAGMSLLRQSRLSVCPISDAEWGVICGMAGIAA